jgi:mRNA-degrading endonuclease toxin of MazEF toxin-antitoxin module
LAAADLPLGTFGVVGMMNKVVDPLDEPFLPMVGDLYWVNTIIFWSSDRKRTRPVVVIESPPDRFGRIMMVTRTSDTTCKGVFHDAMPEIGLTKPGVFRSLASTAASLWTPRNVRRLGPLPAATFDKIVDRYG